MKKNVCNLDCEHCPHPDCIRPEEDLYKYPSWDPANRPPDYKQKQAEGNHRRYTERAEAGLCTQCGKRPPVQGIRLCQECREYQNRHHRRHHMKDYARNKQEGICTRCGKRPAEPGRVCCPECAEVNRQAQRKHNAKRKERKA